MAEVYFIDGFDHRKYIGGNSLKYVDNTLYGIGKANQGTTENGRHSAVALPAVPSNGIWDSAAMFLQNAAFGAICYTKTLAARNRYVVGFNYRPTNPFGQATASDTIFFRWENGAPNPTNNQNTATSLSIRQGASNTLRFYGGGRGTNAFPGTLVANPSYVFTPGQWYFLEVDATFGPGGKLKVFVDSVQIYEDLNVNLGTTNPDRFSLRLEAFGTQGMTFDDLYVADSRLGLCRIITTLPMEDGSPDEWTPTPAGNSYENVDDRNFTTLSNRPDEDTTRLDAASAGLTSVFRFAESTCFGRILAVAVNATVKNPLGASPSIKLVVQPDPTDLTITELSETTLTTSYATYQAMLNLSPLTGTFWTDTELAAAKWGVRSGGSGAGRVTAMFVEKLVSMEGLSYDCGGGTSSYAY